MCLTMRLHLMLGRILALGVAVALASPASAQREEDIARFNTLLRGTSAAEVAGRYDEAFRLASELKDLTPRMLPLGDHSRAFAAFLYVSGAINSNQSDDVIDAAEAHAAAEMANPVEEYLPATYADSAITLHLKGRRELSLKYAKAALDTDWARENPSTLCTAAAQGILAGEAYRQFHQNEGDDFARAYEASINGQRCGLEIAHYSAIVGFDALADGLMRMSPAADTMKRAVDLALQVNTIRNSLIQQHNTDGFFRGVRLVVHYLQLPRPKRDIEAAFQRALQHIPVEIDAMNQGAGEIADWIYIMKEAARADGDTAAMQQLDVLQSRLAPQLPRPSTIVASDSDSALRSAKRALAAARDAMREARRTLPDTSPDRLTVTAMYLGLAMPIGGDPFELHQVAEDAAKDIPRVWIATPTEAVIFEFEATAAMADVDGADQYQSRAAKALKDAQSLYGAEHPCLVKFLLEGAAASYSVHRAEDGDRLFDQAAALYAPSNRCVETGTADSLAILQAMSDVGTQMGVTHAAPERMRKLITLGLGLENDVAVGMQSSAGVAKLQFEGILPLALAANIGDREGALRAVDSIIAASGRFDSVSLVRLCAAATPLLNFSDLNVAAQKAAAMHCEARKP